MYAFQVFLTVDNGLKYLKKINKRIAFLAYIKIIVWWSGDEKFDLFLLNENCLYQLKDFLPFIIKGL